MSVICSKKNHGDFTVKVYQGHQLSSWAAMCRTAAGLPVNAPPKTIQHSVLTDPRRQLTRPISPAAAPRQAVCGFTWLCRLQMCTHLHKAMCDHCTALKASGRHHHVSLYVTLWNTLPSVSEPVTITCMWGSKTFLWERLTVCVLTSLSVKKVKVYILHTKMCHLLLLCL